MKPVPRILPLLLAAALVPLAAGPARPQQPKAEAFAGLRAALPQPAAVIDAKAVVLFFHATDCPIANYYTAEINAVVKDFAAAPVRCFVVHADPALTRDAADKHAQTWKLTCPLLLDAGHKLVKLTGVTVTPEVAVVLPDGTLAYRGRIDDCYAELGKRRVEPTRRDLRDALTAVLKGQAVPEPRTKAIGCFIPELR